MDDSVTKKLNLIAVRDEIRACTRCPLHTVVTSPVPISGPVNAKFIVLGEAPGRVEDYKGVPFVGPAGRILRRKLRENKLREDEAAFMNVVSCWPSGTPNDQSLKACKHNLEIQLMGACSDIILVCGRTALRSLIPHAELKWCQGNIIEVHGFRCVVIWHPSFILQSRSKSVDADVSHGVALLRWLLSGIPRDWATPQYCIYCGKDLYRATPACRNHQKTWTKDAEWTKPEQMKLM